MGEIFNVPVAIIIIYFIFCLSSWNISISYSQTLKDEIWSSELERKMWLKNSFFSLYCLIVNKTFMFLHLVFLIFFAYKSSIFSAVLMFLIPVIPVSIISSLLKSKIPTSVLALAGVFLTPILLIILFYLTQKMF